MTLCPRAPTATPARALTIQLVRLSRAAAIMKRPILASADFKTRIDGKLVDAVAVYTGGRTGAQAIVGKEILATVPCDESFPSVIAGVIRSYRAEDEYKPHVSAIDPLFTAAVTVGLASWRPSGSFAPSPGTP